jgi:hypothetical protein
MDRFFLSLILCASILLFVQPYTSAGHLPVSASCTISCAVKDSAEWGIKTKSANLEEAESEDDLSGERKSLMLYTNSDVEIIATGAGAASLSDDGRPVSTRYILHYDGAAADAAGSGIIAWNDCGSGSEVTYVSGNCAVEVILSVSAIKNPSAYDKSAIYADLHTLTVCWK